jgi:UPF0755 protein
MGRGQHAAKPKRNPLLRILLVLAVLVVLAAAAAALAFSYVEKERRPMEAGNETPVTVIIPEGAGTGGIAALLNESGLTGDPRVFRLQSRLRQLDGRYQAGVFRLNKAMSMDEIMDQLIAGANAFQRFTVPEGYTVAQTGERLAAAGLALVTAEDFLEEVNNGDFSGYAFLRDAPAGENRLEGYLYPQTYDVYVDVTAYGVIDRMLTQFDQLFTEDYYRKAQELGLSVNEVVTIASLIERETRVADERALVSSVIHNRLARGMQLQIDATVQYALGEQKERLLYADLEVDSPYNTYKIPGLPPGPICSPRIECIEAALFPADTNYLYYVLKPELNGAHNFAATAGEFQRFKDQYLNAR